MPRTTAARNIIGAVAFAAMVLAASTAPSHGLAMDQVLLQPDRARRSLRGQITFDPHHTRGEERVLAGDAEQRVLAALRESLVIEVDGARCPLELEVRELWEPAGATVGDIVGLRCPLAPDAREMRVYAGSMITVLAVSIQTSESAGAAASRSVVVQGGTSTPIYRLDGPDAAWRAGGANQFLPDGGLASPDGSVAPNREVQPSGFHESRAAIVKRYVRLGLSHILPLGWDHVLFVAGLVLGANLRLRRLLVELSAFTLAHTVTLGLGGLGFVFLPTRLVEPLIAGSIAFVAFENLRGASSARRRLAIVFGFGFLHGMGFASALAEVGLSRESFLLSLLSFNVGVELGQLVVVAVLVAGLAAIADERSRQRFVVRPASLVIGALGLVWALTRLLA